MAARLLTLRPYQLRIAKVCAEKNTVVLLPTGAGKTLIAANAILRMGHPAALFLVPTIPLVAQQAAALKSCPGMPLVGEYHGGCSIPDAAAGIIVTTPKAFEVAQQRGEPTFAWSRFKSVVFDEVHHVIKDHPYRSLAMKLRSSQVRGLRIIGLTASLTYAVGQGKIEKSIQKLCHDLGIERIEHASDEELRDGGYRGAGRGAVAEVRLPDMNPTMRADVVPVRDRKPHLMHSTFFSRVDQGTATAFSLGLVARVRRIEAVIWDSDHSFRSPLANASLKTWGEYAHSRIGTSPAYKELEAWYESLRLLVVSWEEADDLAVLFLRMMLASGGHGDMFLSSQPQTFKRFENMVTVLHEKINEAPSPSSFRGIMFVQQRVTTHIVEYYLCRDAQLGQHLRPRCLYATTSPATASLSLSKTDSREALSAFQTGEANLLISTSVSEEGLDIPEANCVFYFDPINHAVSYVQGRGRARQGNSSFVVLSQRADRPVSLLAQQEREQHAIASTYAPKKKSLLGASAEITAQTSRERSAKPVLFQDLTEATSLLNFNLYCKKTKATCEESFEKVGQQSQCTLSYRSVLREMSARANGDSNKQAKKRAALKLLGELRRCSIPLS